MTSIHEFSNKQLESYQDSNSRINIFEGPVRAGKSFICLLRWLEFCRNGPPGAMIICGRTDKTIKRNIINPLQDLVGPAVQYSSGKGEVVLYNRTMYVVGANDDRAEAKIRGSEFAGALIDELTLLPENFIKMLLSRLSIRGAALFASTNADSPFHWVKTDLIDRQHELNCSVFSFTIDDNPSLSEEFKNELKKEYQGLWYKRYIEGKWVMAEGTVYDFFDEDINVIKFKPGEAAYYIVGIDYGTTNPCVFTLIGYNPNEYPNMWLEKEYYYDSKKHNRQKSDYEYSKDLIEFISGHNIEAIYIDPSAASFKQELRRNDVQNVRDAKNDVLPGIRYQGQLLMNGTYKICSCCTESIKEYTNYVWDSKASAKGEDKPIKQSDHCFDGDMKITTLSGKTAIKNIKKGDKVLTPVGYKDVLKVLVHDDVLYEYNIFGKIIRCTENHKFYTANRGWIEIKDLLKSDILLTNTFNEACPQKQSFLMKSHIEGTHTPKVVPLENIIQQLKDALIKDITLYTGRFGDFTREKFQKDTMFITGTEIPQTMILVTSNYYLQKNMRESILKYFQKNKKSACVFNAIQNIKQENTEEESFVQIDVKASGEETINLILRKGCVQSVLKSLELISTQKQRVVQNRVEEKTIGEKTQLKESLFPLNVNSVEKNLKNTTQHKENFVHHRVPLNCGKKKKVYNLHVEGLHTYYVNDLLTSNCMDSSRYALFSHFFERTGSKMSEEEANILENAFSFRRSL